MTADLLATRVTDFSKRVEARKKTLEETHNFYDLLDKVRLYFTGFVCVRVCVCVCVQRVGLPTFAASTHLIICVPTYLSHLICVSNHPFLCLHGTPPACPFIYQFFRLLYRPVIYVSVCL